MRILLALLLCAAIGFAFTGVSVADDKEVTLKGEVKCAKCHLKEAGGCATVIVVKAGGKDVVYYFDKDSHKKHHDDICKTAKPGMVKGVVEEKDGKKIVVVKEYKLD